MKSKLEPITELVKEQVTTAEKIIVTGAVKITATGAEKIVIGKLSPQQQRRALDFRLKQFGLKVRKVRGKAGYGVTPIWGGAGASSDALQMNYELENQPSPTLDGLIPYIERLENSFRKGLFD